MKLIINGDTVEIRVKSKYSERANKKDTLYFLNDLGLFAYEAKEHYKILGLHGAEMEAKQAADDIYNYLKTNDFFTDKY